MPLIYTIEQREPQSGEKRKREENNAEGDLVSEFEAFLSAMYTAAERAETSVQYVRPRQLVRQHTLSFSQPEQYERSRPLEESALRVWSRLSEKPEQPEQLVQISLMSTAQAQAEIEAHNHDDDLSRSPQVNPTTALPRGTFQDYVRVAEAVLDEIERGHFPACGGLIVNHTLLGQMARVFLDSHPLHLFFDERRNRYNWWPVVQHMRTFGIRWFAEQFSCFLHERASEYRQQREGRQRERGHRRMLVLRATRIIRQQRVQDLGSRREVVEAGEDSESDAPTSRPLHGREPSIVFR